MKRIRNLSENIYFWNGSKFVPYGEMEDHFKEMNQRLDEAEETATKWRKKYRLLCLQVNTVNELAMKKNEFCRPINEEPEWKLMLKWADFGSAAMEPVSQDYDAMRDLEKTEGNGELPFVV